MARWSWWIWRCARGPGDFEIHGGSAQGPITHLPFGWTMAPGDPFLNLVEMLLAVQ